MSEPRAIGVLLVNLGTPEAPTSSAIRRYLWQFLSDRRVVELPRPLWLPILGAILTFRPVRLAHAYRKIWSAEGSPLLRHTRALGAGLERALRAALGREVAVAVGMTYGQPSIDQALRELEARAVERVLVLPLYPQYSATTTAAAYDALHRALAARRRLPELRTLNGYHDHPAHIEALAQSVRAHWDARGRGEHLLLSFHGIPQRYVQAGDPYERQCRETARLLAEKLQLREAEWSLAYQSRFGKAAWVQPYTDQHLSALAARGIRRLDVICPGFAADCLETLEEVALRYADAFRAGGGELRYIPALNADAAQVAALGKLAAEHLSGW